jgi:hypothetical protein
VPTSPSSRQNRGAPSRPPAARYAAVSLGLFSGVALLLNILASVSLPLALTITATAVLFLLAGALRSVDAAGRAWIGRTVAIGAVSGMTATVMYDAAKGLLSQLDPSPYNPFEALRVFGGLLLGASAAPAMKLLAGTGLHLLNGTCFGVAYTLIVAPRGGSTRTRAALYGVSWGLFLEAFQLTLYPGWLNINYYTEFATISALSHVVYGLVLAGAARSLLGRANRSRAVGASRSSHATKEVGDERE